MNFLEKLENDAAKGECSLPTFCAKVASLFQVQAHEVAVLELRHSMLQFAHPVELRNTGLIPLISSAQAAKTATSKRAEIFNSFIAVRHSSVFETVRVNGKSPTSIQKLISAPILDEHGDVVGVIQVCRKGATPMDSGPDFETSDLHELRNVAASLGRILRLLERRLESTTAPATTAPDAGVQAELT